MTDCTGAAKPIGDSQFVGDDEPTFGDETKFIFVRLSVLREYLRKDLEMPNLPFPYDFERAIDDWVFMCFFVGNDFLPHLPSLEIRENAIDRLVRLYKDAVYKTGVSLTSLTINLKPDESIHRLARQLSLNLHLLSQLSQAYFYLHLSNKY